MEPRIFRYIWQHTKRDQVWIVCIVAMSMIPYYLAFDLPKSIVNMPIMGEGFAQPGDTQPLLQIAFDLPFLGHVELFPGIPLERLPMLLALSLLFLALVVVNGLFKVYINTYKGRLGERLLRRFRYDLVDRILRFPPSRFKSMKAGEISSMIKDEVEPLGGFTADAFVQPALLGGQALTALVFIFMQHFWLGAVAAFMALIQAAIIPRMRRRLIVLGRERQLTARQLAGRVSEIVDGISTIHATDTTNFVRAEISGRLGTIFRIRYNIYQWKFLIKFLNNFLAQMTPFLFYSIGGYLTIMGRLDVGQLVAVINAYKELPGPLKELIDWDLQRQDVQVKYEQVIEQFDGDELIDPALHRIDPATEKEGEPQVLHIRGLSVASDAGTALLSRVTLDIAPGERVAFIGPAGAGGETLAEAIARVQWPSEGRIQLGEDDLLHLPEAVSARRISYASPAEFFFSGSLQDNLLFALKNAPRVPHEYPENEVANLRWIRNEARLAGNSELDPMADWIDAAALCAHTGEERLFDAVLKILTVVEMKADVFELALRSHLAMDSDSPLVPAVVDLRQKLRDLLAEKKLSHLVQPFQPGAYNEEATIGENLLFGRVAPPETSILPIVRSHYFREVLVGTGLGAELFRIGHTIADIAVNLFEDMPFDHSFYERMHLFAPEDLPSFKKLVKRVDPENYEGTASDDRIELMKLVFSYSENWYRFGVLDDATKQRIVEVRELLHRDLPADLAALIQTYDPKQFLFGGDILENLLFGKINKRLDNADAQVRSVIVELLRDHHRDVAEQILRLGLDYNVGTSGRRLSAAQRHKLTLARALMRSSDYYVFNRTLLGIDRTQQSRIVEASLAFLGASQRHPSVIWVLSDSSHARNFDRVVRFEQGSVVEDTESETCDNKAAIA